MPFVQRWTTPTIFSVTSSPSPLPTEKTRRLSFVVAWHLVLLNDHFPLCSNAVCFGCADDSGSVDAVSLSLFSHRFMGIAEQMGRTLQRTAISTNIKERLDFSCAIFDDSGGLVANAPHVPVHLGSMQDAVRYQIRTLGAGWKEKEVILTNHPVAGGSHLPDVTIITPVYSRGKPIFYVASRGHQCDIGGLTPGSMPPFSVQLDEEG